MINSIYIPIKEEYFSLRKKKRGYNRKKKQFETDMINKLLAIGKLEQERFGIPPIQITTLR